MSGEGRPEDKPEDGAQTASSPQDASTEAPAAEASADPEPATASGNSDPRPRRKGGLASRLLTLIVVLIAGAGLAVWGLPKIAPQLPAPVADFLAPATGLGAEAAGSGEEIEALRARLAELEGSIEDVSVVAETAVAANQGATDRIAEFDQRIRALSEQVEEAAQAARAAPSGDASGVDAGRIADLEEQVEALASSGGGSRVDPQALSAIESEIATLRDAVEELRPLGERLTALAERVDSLESGQSEIAALREEALSEAQGARRAATVGSALAEIDRAMTLGRPFAASLNDVVEASGMEAPTEIAAAAENGAPTRESLKASFPAAAFRAIDAALAAEAGDDTFREIVAHLEARVTGLPSEPIAGDSPPAVLSRARAELLQGDLDAAIAAVEALPAPAREAMNDWLEGARLRSAADHALADWRAQIKLTL